jgi:ATP-dependent DNA helicase PIF1
LCQEQRDLVDLILKGANVFYTGSAGCGKSTVLRVFVKKLQAQGKQVKILAPTGRAAVDIGGQTIHAYAGITPDSLKLELDKLRNKAHGRVVSKRFSETDVLVIDEISMVENQLLERLSEMLKAGRQYHNRKLGLDDTLPFGGVQCVFLGDFFQRMHHSLVGFHVPGC